MDLLGAFLTLLGFALAFVLKKEKIGLPIKLAGDTVFLIYIFNNLEKIGLGLLIITFCFFLLDVFLVAKIQYGQSRYSRSD